MKSLVVKRSVVLAGHKTSISLEDAFWKSLKEIAQSGNMNLSELLTAIDSSRQHGNLSSAIRLFVLNFYREQIFHRIDVPDNRKIIQGLLGGSMPCFCPGRTASPRTRPTLSGVPSIAR